MVNPFDPVTTAQVVSRHHPVIDTDPRQTETAGESTTLPELKRWNWWSAGMLLLAGLVSVRLFELQVLQGSVYRESAEQNRRRIQTIPAARGSIVDRDNRIIAENIPNFVLSIVPADFPTDRQAQQIIWEKISSLTGVPVETFHRQLNEYTGSQTEAVPIIEHLSPEQALPLMIQTVDLPGVTIDSFPSRRYASGTEMAHVVGYIGAVSPEELKNNPELRITAQTGKAGLEQVYNDILSGIDGRKEVERDVYNQRHEILQQQAPITGRTLVLSIQAELQRRLYERLDQAVRSARSTGGAAVVMDPRDGAILAIASIPSYDPNWFLDRSAQPQVRELLHDQRHPLLNRAIAGQYPSGSIIKPLIAVAGMNEGIVSANTSIQSTGGLQIGRDRFPDWKSGGHGATNLAKALAESVNTYFYILGGGYEDRAGLGVDRIVDYLERFGWGSRLGLDLPGEAAGLLPTREWRTKIRSTPWRLGDTYHLSIGQGDLQVTPLQVVTAISAIANGGTLFQPHLVMNSHAPDGSDIKSYDSRVIRQLNISPSALEAVRSGMRQGVISGSSQALQSLPVPAAGKTGTAEFGNDGKTHAWYVGFAPYDHPTIAIAVIVEGGGEGHATALPVAKEILAWYFRENQLE